VLIFKLITHVYTRKSVSDRSFVAFMRLNFILTYETFNGEILVKCETFSTKLEKYLTTILFIFPV
jgi:hypothetical protein